MKRTIAYIDGYNLYYGLLKGTPWKWLDPEALVRSQLRTDHEIVSVRYFTAPIRTYPHDNAAVDRQKIYLQALSTRDRVCVTLGYYSKNATLLPAYDEICKTCEQNRHEKGLLRVVKLEEKQSDVNIASAMIFDAARDAADSFVLVSGDTDFIAPVRIVRKEFLKSVIVLNPHLRHSDLERHASYYKDIAADVPQRCQLPYEIPFGKNGSRIVCPPEWRRSE